MPTFLIFLSNLKLLKSFPSESVVPRPSCVVVYDGNKQQTKDDDIWYVIINLVRILLSTSAGNFIVVSIFKTLPIVWYLLQVHRTVRRWTISILNTDRLCVCPRSPPFPPKKKNIQVSV